ncbi:TrkH family potassium uptake protein [Primorskyibacter sp. S187A]|uniref:TrkH family potassium uptake protein n=1 Tax=Primorskyibacter sp. S187A TaxID=3415130 RepID=UPI003C7B46F0
MRLRFAQMPLFLQLCILTGAMMVVPAVHALTRQDFHEARSFFYGGLLTLIVSGFVAISLMGRRSNRTALRQLMALLAAFTVLPIIMAIPFAEALQTTTFLNAYFEMVSSFTTTGATLFAADRLSDTLHLWRALVGWSGGLLIWVAAAAILAPLNLGGFELTASAEPGRGEGRLLQMDGAEPATRMVRVVALLLPIYAGLTAVLWVCLLVAGDPVIVALCHALSTMSTSGITPLADYANHSSGFAGEVLVFLFLLFALSRLTFSNDTVTGAGTDLRDDPEFRIGLLLVLVVPLMLFLRHWLGAYDVNEEAEALAGLRALWGSVFTVLSFVSTTGFVSGGWEDAQNWSGLGTPGLILLGLAMVGGGVATTAGGVKLLRVFALYLNGVREMQRLMHPSSVGNATPMARRLRRQGAVVAWVFFMLFALSLASTTVLLAGLGVEFDAALVIAVSTLSTTGPLMAHALSLPIDLTALSDGAKIVAAAAMVLGRLETLAIVALFSPELWRD